MSVLLQEVYHNPDNLKRSLLNRASCPRAPSAVTFNQISPIDPSRPSSRHPPLSLQVIIDNDDNPALHIMADKPRRYPIFYRFCDRHLLMCAAAIAIAPFPS